MVQTNPELIEGCRCGDPIAQRELFDAYKGKAFGILYGIVGEREACRDLLQEVFIKVFRSIDRFRGDSDPGTWIHRISVNTALDHVRKKQVPQVSMDDVGEIDPAECGDETPKSVDPHQALEGAELGGRIAEAMGTLPPAHRAAILLREVEGLSYREIAESMDCSIGTVMSRLHYARERLRSLLAGAGGTENGE
ncbi:RNA polymerase sigma factor [Thermodesulfobacteriota bacterium]